MNNFQRKVPGNYHQALQYALPQNFPITDYNYYNDNNSMNRPSLPNENQDNEKKEQVASNNTSRYKPKASNPLIFKPPKVLDQQIIYNEKKNHPSDQIKSEDNLYGKTENDRTSSGYPQTDASTLNEDLVGRFSAMLEDSSSLQEESLSNQVEISVNEGLLISEDESSLNEDLVEKFSAMLEERTISEEESSSAEDDNSFLIGESSSSLDESSSKQEESHSLSEESSSTQKEFYSLSEESSSAYEESSAIHEDSSSLSGGWDSREQLHLPIVKLPVLLAILNIDINIFESYDLFSSVSKVTKIEWSLHSLECDVLLPSTYVFLRGVLIADVEYVKENDTHSLHTQKLRIPWEKITKINWLHSPKLPSSHQAEYMFQLFDHGEIQYHREFTQEFAEKINFDLQRINFIWHNELNSKVGNPEMDIQGKVNLSICLLQSQYVELNTL